MDDFNVGSLHESKNEWGSRLITILTPLVIDGYKSILEEAVKLCKDGDFLPLYRSRDSLHKVKCTSVKN